MSFKKPRNQVRRVSKYLFDEPDHEPNEVGEKCFDLILEEAEG